MSANSNPIRRCAIYTRKSSEEGLEQDFNSLHAQRESCEAYIRSQGGEGWRLVKTGYDDGGLSGGTMERPALQRLLADIKHGLIDIVVVYKVDRLTRSLMDFAKIVEQLDRHGASFVAVTQQFNTSTSMGRLTLNVLLSFAQFEREVTAERIRDKIAASKRKGMWMGGNLPLGYDVENRKLVINEPEAITVRLIFKRYLELGSVRLLQQDLNKGQIRSKVQVTKEGKRSGGHPFSRGALYTLLANPIYIGEIRHKTARYDGQHIAILDRPLWDAVQQQLRNQGGGGKGGVGKSTSSPLAGKLFDENGDRLTPSHAVKQGRRYRYYVSRRLITGIASETESGWRLPAPEIEDVIANEAAKILEAPATVREMIRKFRLARQRVPTLLQHLKSHASRLRFVDTRSDALSEIVDRIELGHEGIVIKLSGLRLIGGNVSPDTPENSIVERGLTMKLKRRGVETKLIVGGIETRSTEANPALIKLISRAYRWWDGLVTGQVKSIAEIAETEKLSERYVSGILEVAFLAPSIVERVVAGRQPPGLTWQTLTESAKLPIGWLQQRNERLVGEVSAEREQVRPSGS